MFKKGNNSEFNFPNDNFLKTLRIFIVLFLVGAIGILVVTYFIGQKHLVYLAIFFISLLVASFLYLLRGNTFLAQLTLPATFVITIFIVVINGFGLHDTGMFGFAAVITLANLTLGQRGAFAFAGLVILTILGIGTAELRGFLISETSTLTSWNSIISSIVLVLVYTAFQEMLTFLYRQTTKFSQQNEKVQSNVNQELRELNIKLDYQINDKNRQLQKNANQLAAISDLSHASASIQDIDELLNRSANLISKIIGFDQVAIFLLDDTGTRIFLRAANGTQEIEKMERSYALSIDTDSIVSNVVKNQTLFSSQISQQGTRPEIAAPLMAGRRLIGVLDIQSYDNEGFSKEDVAIVTILSDILTVAIENTKLMESTRDALIESVQSFQSNVKQAWYQHSKRLDQLEYQYHNGELVTDQSRETDKNNTITRLSIPLFVRGQKIGVLDIKPKQNLRKWTKDEIALVEAAADRTALTLENARLLDDSQRRANREQVIGDMSTKITTMTDTETILQTAVLELGRQIGDAKVSIEINPKSD